jgi:hypothetical protein
MSTERVLQAWIVKKLKESGCLVYKQGTESQAGLPDLLVIPLNAPAYMIEVKSPTGRGRLSKLQKHMAAVLRAQGMRVEVIGSKEEFYALIE